MSDILERFWAKVDRRGPDECWPWLAGVGSHGYGAFYPSRRKQVLAHRFALTLESPTDLRAEATHECDNKVCVNPRHLRWALHEQNMAAFRYVLGQYAPGNRPAVWAAWGTLIEKRPYLFDALEQMLAIGEEYHAQWLTFGARSKAGHPHHPLYLRRDSVPEAFDVRAYCAAQRARLK